MYRGKKCNIENSDIDLVVRTYELKLRDAVTKVIIQFPRKDSLADLIKNNFGFSTLLNMLKWDKL